MKKGIKGLFGMIGFKTSAGANMAMGILQKAWTKGRSQINGLKSSLPKKGTRGATPFRALNRSLGQLKKLPDVPVLIPAKIEGFSGFQFSVKGREPSYVLAKGSVILFASHSSVVKSFVKVWSGKEPSFAQIKSHPAVQSRLNQGMYTFTIFPEPIWDLVTALGPPPVKMLASRLLDRLQGIHAWWSINNQSYSGNLALPIAPKPVRTNKQNEQRRKEIQLLRK